jgi:hypothetical protein
MSEEDKNPEEDLPIGDGQSADSNEADLPGTGTQLPATGNMQTATTQPTKLNLQLQTLNGSTPSRTLTRTKEMERIL